MSGQKKACPYCKHTEFAIWDIALETMPSPNAPPFDREMIIEYICIHCGKAVKECDLIDAKYNVLWEGK